MPKSLLILDLDETLVHATEQPLVHRPHFEVPPHHVYKRPLLTPFLEACSAHFELAVWTSASSDYASAVIGEIWPPTLELSFLWSRTRCTRRLDLERMQQILIKDLKKVKKMGYSLERVLMVDDSPSKLSRQYGNLVRVKPFVGDLEDDELRWLSLFLIELAEVDNVRQVEKRGWRTRMSGQED